MGNSLKSIIFFQGGGSEQDYEADAKLVASLQRELGPEYSIHYPSLPDAGTPDLGRRDQIARAIAAGEDNSILVAHSLGASMLLAYLSETTVKKPIGGIFLLATPFWSGTENWVQAFKLQTDFAEQLNRTIPLYFYHCRDDEEVPFNHLQQYQQQLPWAVFREIAVGGHQLNNDLTVVAQDINRL